MPNEFVARNGIIALNNSTVTGSLDVTTNVTSPSFTGSLYGTASWAESASIATNIQGGTQYYVPVWTGVTTLGTSSLYESGSVLKSVYQGNDIGLKLDFANDEYQLGRGFGDVGNYGYLRFFDYNNDDPAFELKLNSPNYNVKTGSFKYNPEEGFELLAIKSTNEYLSLGANQSSFGLNISSGSTNVTLQSNGISQRIYSGYNGYGRGLDLNFAVAQYSLGDYGNTSGSTKLVIDDNSQTLSISGSTVITGSLAVTNITDGSGLDNVILYNTASGQFYYTSSAAIGGGDPFPYVGTAEITGSLLINTGSLNINVVQKLIDLEADIIAFAVAL